MNKYRGIIDKPIISNFSVGWLTFELGNYSCQASYLTHVADDLLDACIEKFKNPWKTPCVRLDEEDTGDTFIIFHDFLFITKNKRVFCRDDYYWIEDFAKSLVKTIEDNLDSIIKDFYCCEISLNVEPTKRRLKRKVKIMKKLLRRKAKIWD